MAACFCQIPELSFSNEKEKSRTSDTGHSELRWVCLREVRHGAHRATMGTPHFFTR